MAVRAVFFDVDGTLVHLVVSPEDIWTAAIRRQEVDADSAQVASALRHADGIMLPRVSGYRARRKDFWLAYTHAVLDRLGITDSDGEKAHGIQRMFDDPRWYRVWPEVPGTLETLRSRGFRLAIVSNNTDRLPRRLEELGLSQYFHDLTFSEEAGCLKPDPAIFELALRRASCAPGAAVHVGDDYDADVRGARAAGLSPILVDREDRHRDADCPRIRDLSQLAALLH